MSRCLPAQPGDAGCAPAVAPARQPAVTAACFLLLLLLLLMLLLRTAAPVCPDGTSSMPPAGSDMVVTCDSVMHACLGRRQRTRQRMCRPLGTRAACTMGAQGYTDVQTRFVAAHSRHAECPAGPVSVHALGGGAITRPCICCTARHTTARQARQLAVPSCDTSLLAQTRYKNRGWTRLRLSRARQPRGSSTQEAQHCTCAAQDTRETNRRARCSTHDAKPQPLRIARSWGCDTKCCSATTTTTPLLHRHSCCSVHG
jgi:hypothetical protein